MFDNRKKKFAFVSEAVEADTFEVVRFKGTEGLSQLYRYEITLVSENPEVDLKALVKHPASLVIKRDDDDYPIHGMLSSFEQSRQVDRYTSYRAVLVPRIWQADRFLETQLFIEQSVPEIIQDIFQQAGINPTHYELRLTGSYPPWEYICQYRETDFDFISRWMEREGIYYYFEQSEKGEKMIITDNLAAHGPIKGTPQIAYHQPSGLSPAKEETVSALTSTYNSQPHKVVLRDYNYRKPDMDLTCEAAVDPEGFGKAYTYGEHYKTPEEGRALAKIRAEELLCEELVFNGESSVPTLVSGFIFELEDHYRNDYNQKYLIRTVTHEGHQTGYLFAGMDAASQDDGPGYLNRFSAIAADVQYRPERGTVRPRIAGTMNATVDSESSGQYAEIDELGRYKVRLPFDMGSKNNMKASRWVRMAQPYAGPDYGSHFPLHKKTEVVLSFIDGNPDRPYIAAAIPNPDTISPITSDNLTKSMIRSASGNEYHLEDKEGSENIYTRAVKDQTSDVANNRTKTVGRDENMKIGNNKNIRVGANHEETIGADKSISVGASHEETIGTNKSINVGANHSETIAANMNLNVGAMRSVNIAAAESKTVAGGSSTKIGGTQTVSVGGSASESVGIAKALNVGAAYAVNVGGAMNTIVGVSSSEEVGIAKIIYAGNSIIIKSGGSLKIDAKSVEITGKSGVKINGSVVDIN